MAGKSGKVLLLKVGDGASPEVFHTVGGARDHSVDVNLGLIDDSDKDSGGWSSVGPFGLKSIKVTLDGVYKGSVGELIVINHCNDVSDARPALNVQLIEQGVGTWAYAAFAKRDIKSPHEGMLANTYTFDNQGAAVFTAESPQY